MSVIAKCGVRFFLTGGTAISRGFYNHRYSDDLDFFVNNDSEYSEQVDEVLRKLKESIFNWNIDSHYVRNDYFTRVMVTWDKSDAELKLDFVNDTAPHFGDITETSVYHRTDCIGNMLSNKLSAIYRFEPKDIADIREIALHERVDWTQAIREAREKDAGVELIYVSQILSSIPQSEFDKIAWAKKVTWEQFKADIDKISKEMLEC